MQAAKWAGWFRQNISRESTSGFLTPRILETGGNAALRAGQHELAEALYHSAIYVLSRNLDLAFDGHATYAKSVHGRARVMHGIACFFQQKHDKAQASLRAARFMGTNDVSVYALEALLLAKEGKLGESAYIALRGNLPSWLLKPLGLHILEASAVMGGSSASNNEIEELKFHLKSLAARVHTPSDLIHC